MYLDFDRWRKLMESMKQQSTPKGFGQYWNSRKAKRRGGARRK